MNIVNAFLSLLTLVTIIYSFTKLRKLYRSQEDRIYILTQRLHIMQTAIKVQQEVIGQLTDAAHQSSQSISSMSTSINLINDVLKDLTKPR